MLNWTLLYFYQPLSKTASRWSMTISRNWLNLKASRGDCQVSIFTHRALVMMNETCNWASLHTGMSSASFWSLTWMLGSCAGLQFKLELWSIIQKTKSEQKAGRFAKQKPEFPSRNIPSTTMLASFHKFMRIRTLQAMITLHTASEYLQSHIDISQQNLACPRGVKVRLVLS